ncbi:large ribosomal subunit protein mL48 [Gouania willdenowi]|uniref:Small ribosomal subunit protein uS10 domain-containing protein n=1 Tax=Gouania willdenowi TaxID=441366 RepID=A0A8C5G0U2_GOUWI|nr:39S ribosomal protein L48, mitochondrial [Gouania willdenowi]
MNPVFRKAFLFNQAFGRCSFLVQQPLWNSAAAANQRTYRGASTEGIGRWKHLLPKQAQRKKKDKLQMKPIVEATPTSYGTLNVTVSGYDVVLVEHFSQFIHNLCNRLHVPMSDSYALPTQSTELMLLQQKGTKTLVDAVLKTHHRVLQLSSLDACLCPVFMDVVLKNQPEGVQLCVKEHTEAEFHQRFKARPELEGLVAQIGS